MTRGRAGRSTLGCLVMLLVLVAVAYFGLNAGEAYWRFYQYRDAMTQQARFAEQFNDAQITRALQAKADSLGLPEEAAQVHVRRSAREIRIWAAYAERVDLPGLVRMIHFAPSAERTF